MARAIPCPCGHPSCKAWMVEPQAAIQGVNFTEQEARAIAFLLNSEGKLVGEVLGLWEKEPDEKPDMEELVSTVSELLGNAEANGFDSWHEEPRQVAYELRLMAQDMEQVEFEHLSEAVKQAQENHNGPN